MPRRFPPPWRAERMPGGYVVRDANNQALAYIYSRANEAEAMQAKKSRPITKDGGWRQISPSCRPSQSARTDGLSGLILSASDRGHANHADRHPSSRRKRR